MHLPVNARLPDERMITAKVIDFLRCNPYNSGRDDFAGMLGISRVHSGAMMRSVIAILTTIVLVVIATSCGSVCLLGAASNTAGDCCPQHHSSHMPCGSKPGIQQCPYSILARAKTVATDGAVVAPPAAVLAPLPADHQSTSKNAPQRLADSAGLFLRLRVLLI